MSKKITGIKSVDLKISASGKGVVNWNGTASVYSHQAEQYVSNHLLPKLRGVDMMRVKDFKDIDEKARLYVSSNCIRHELFKEYSYNLKSVTLSNVASVLASVLGLVRGYVIAEGSTSLKRKSCLLMEDFVSDEKTTLEYEQFSQAGARNETSIFSKHTTNDVNYTAYASINIEDLQFLPLEDSLGRSCFREIVSEEEGIELAKEISDYLKTLDFDEKYSPEAVFSNNYVRKNAISKSGEAGILLNDDAITLIVNEVIDLIKSVYIQKSSAYLKVDRVVVDFNDGKTMRIKDSEEEVEFEKSGHYAVYYEAMPFTSEEYRKMHSEKENTKKDKKSKK